MKKIIIISLIIISCLGLISCNKEKVVKSDTPANVGLLIKMAITNKDYEAFNNLFSEDIKGIITEKEFNEFNKISTVGSSHKLYTTISFQNGEILLVKITTEKINGEYKVEDVIQIPDEMKYFFEDKK